MTEAGISFTFKLNGTLWDPGFDPFYQFDIGPEPNTQDAVEFDERGYWQTVGTSDGEQGIPSKVEFIPTLYQYYYSSGYKDGLWKYMIIHYTQ